MRGAATVRHVDLRQAEPTVPDADLVFDVYWWGDLPIGSRPRLRVELPLGPGQLRALAADLLTSQLAGREMMLGAPLAAGSEGRPHGRLNLDRALRLDNIEGRVELLASVTLDDATGISLVICTRDRPAALARCLSSLAQQRRKAGQTIVVDNSAGGSARSVCATFPELTYVHEPSPGLSRARNAGVRNASRPIIAFTDDDVEPHPNWLGALAHAFRIHEVDCITGLVLPAVLETEAQQDFQLSLGAFGGSFIPLLFDSRFFAETRPSGAHVWRIGAGANMAFRRTAFERAGLFDERLGAGASGCSEDSEFWYRLLALGGACLFEPRAVVFHHHRAERHELSTQMKVYMRGHASALVAQADAFGDQANLHRLRWQLPQYFFRTALSCIWHQRWRRLQLLSAEISGWITGLSYLLRPSWRQRAGEWPTL